MRPAWWVLISGWHGLGEGAANRHHSSCRRLRHGLGNVFAVPQGADEGCPPLNRDVHKVR